MTTALQDGARRCDARCHEAEGDECRCICGGRNHGRARAGARQERLPLPDDERDRPARGT